MTLKKRSGFGYFLFGVKLTTTPGIRMYVFFPLLTNLLFIGSALYYLFSHAEQWVSQLMEYIPGFLSWLSYLIWPLLVLSVLFISMYFFSSLANIIAAPFNGLLSEKVEQLLDGQPPEQEGYLAFLRDIPRTLAREWRKIRYTLPKMMGLLILMLIPGIGQTVGPVIWFIFTSWMLAIQYCDYPFDNHKVGFNTMRSQLKRKQGCAYSFGIFVNLFTTIPILNLLVMPAAVCGATAMWVTEFKSELTTNQQHP
jgi:CysZ protein